MSFLSDRDMKAAHKLGHFSVTPWEPDLHLQPASIDLRLGPDFWLPEPSAAPVSILRGERPPRLPGRRVVPSDGRFLLRPLQFCLARTLERVHVGPFLEGIVDGKSTLGRLALIVHCTAGFVDPGFEGTVTLELFNAGEYVLELVAGAPICQLRLAKLVSPPERLYGSDDLCSHYQGQDDVQPAR